MYTMVRVIACEEEEDDTTCTELVTVEPLSGELTETLANATVEANDSKRAENDLCTNLASEVYWFQQHVDSDISLCETSNARVFACPAMRGVADVRPDGAGSIAFERSRGLATQR